MALLASATSLSCGVLWHGEPTAPEPIPTPEAAGYHDHFLRLYVKNINAGAETLHLVQAMLPVRGVTCLRPPGNQGGNSSVAYVVPGANINTVGGDTGFTVYQLPVRHFANWQREHQGDTTRLSSLDNLGPWQMNLDLQVSRGITAAGETLTLYAGSLPAFPDTVRPGLVLEVEVVFDLAGLYSVVPYQNKRELRLNYDHISYRQRPAPGCARATSTTW